MKVTKDFKAYLDHIDKLSKGLDKRERKELETILGVILTLVISLKHYSGLGSVSMEWLTKYRRK